MNPPAEAQLLAIQRAFAAYLRDPEQAVPPGAHEARRLDVYRTAVYANIEGFMRDNYPRVRAVMNDPQWHAMVRDYLLRHRARAAAFVDLPREFLAYLEHTFEAPASLPFLAEVAHFDWLESLLGADPRCLRREGIDHHGDLLTGVPVANPIMVMQRYRFPVHAIGSAYLPEVAPAQTTVIAAFRDTQHEYGFLDLNPAAARLLELIMLGEGLTGREIFSRIATELGQADLAGLIEAGGTILARMLARDVILGSASA